VLFSLGPFLCAVMMSIPLQPFTSELTRGVKRVDDRVIVKIGTQTQVGGVGWGWREVVH
jgi:hypothetical protein